MLHRTFITCLILCIASTGVFAQKTNAKAGFSGMLMAATDGRSVYVNLGGPGVKWSKEEWSAGVYMLPTLRLRDDKPRPLVTPTLGAGVIIGYCKLLFGIPVYYSAADLKWKVAFGLGVKLGK